MGVGRTFTWAVFMTSLIVPIGALIFVLYLLIGVGLGVVKP
jgi:hypothetical protein